MEHKLVDQTVLLRLDVGEEIHESIQKVAEYYNIKTAQVSAIGAVERTTVGFYDSTSQEYHTIKYDEGLELTSLQGNISQNNGKYHGHFHITLSDREGNVYGGHLIESYIHLTCEIFIRIIDTTVERQHEEATGITRWDLSK